MAKYHQKPGDRRQATAKPAVSRRVMLIASGGLMLGLGGAVGCASQPLAAAKLDHDADAGPGRAHKHKPPAHAQTQP